MSNTMLYACLSRHSRPSPHSAVQVWLAALFAIATAVTTFNASGVPLLEFFIAPFSTQVG